MRNLGESKKKFNNTNEGENSNIRHESSHENSLDYRVIYHSGINHESIDYPHDPTRQRIQSWLDKTKKYFGKKDVSNRDWQQAGQDVSTYDSNRYRGSIVDQSSSGQPSSDSNPKRFTAIGWEVQKQINKAIQGMDQMSSQKENHPLLKIIEKNFGNKLKEKRETISYYLLHIKDANRIKSFVEWRNVIRKYHTQFETAIRNNDTEGIENLYKNLSQQQSTYEEAVLDQIHKQKINKATDEDLIKNEEYRKLVEEWIIECKDRIEDNKDIIDVFRGNIKDNKNNIENANVLIKKINTASYNNSSELLSRIHKTDELSENITIALKTIDDNKIKLGQIKKVTIEINALNHALEAIHPNSLQKRIQSYTANTNFLYTDLDKIRKAISKYKNMYRIKTGDHQI